MGDRAEYESLIVDGHDRLPPGGPAHTIADRDTSFRLGDYVRSPGESNTLSDTCASDGDVLIVDASYNGIIRRSRSSGALSDFCLFPPSGQIDVVPTASRMKARFYIGTLTDYRTQGCRQSLQDQRQRVPSAYAAVFTAIVDIARNPVDGTIGRLEHGDSDRPWTEPQLRALLSH